MRVLCLIEKVEGNQITLYNPETQNNITLSVPDDTELIIFANKAPIRAKKAYQFELFPAPENLLNQNEYEYQTDPAQIDAFEKTVKEYEEKYGKQKEVEQVNTPTQQEPKKEKKETHETLGEELVKQLDEQIALDSLISDNTIEDETTEEEEKDDNIQDSTETTQENESEENVDEALNNIMSGMFDDE